MPEVIKPEDYIPSSSELAGTTRLGLPLVPQASAQALAALNAISRILDQKAMLNSGGVASGDYEVEGTFTATELAATTLSAVNAAITSLALSSLNSSVGNITTLSSQNIAAASGEYDVLSTTSLESTNANIVNAIVESAIVTAAEIVEGTITSLTSVNAAISSLIATAIQVAQANLTNLNCTAATITTLNATTATVGTLKANRVEVTDGFLGGVQQRIDKISSSYISVTPIPHGVILSFEPDEIHYTLHIRGTVGLLISGTYIPSSGAAQYTVVEDTLSTFASDIRTGTGFPPAASGELYSLDFDYSNKMFSITGAAEFAYANAEPFTMTIRSIKYPVPQVS